VPDELERMDGETLIRAILRAPADLLWNGGIGTYVKASYESHADVGDTPTTPSAWTPRSCAAGCWARAATSA
jgi:hypothetical protein